MERDVILGPMPRTREWYEMRPQLYTASDAAAICGMDPWRTTLHVYAEKTGEAPPPAETLRMKIGRELEPTVIGEYHRRTGRRVKHPLPLYISRDKPWIAATPDAWAYSTPEGWPLDAKVSTSFRLDEYGEEFTDDVPISILFQLQLQIRVCGSEKAEVVTLIDNDRVLIHTVARNDAMIEEIELCIDELRECVEARQPPEPDFSHKSTARLIRSMYGIDEDLEIAASDEIARKWTLQERIGQNIAVLAENRQRLRTEILHEMGKAGAAILPSGKAEIRRRRVQVSGHYREPYEYLRLERVARQRPRGPKHKG